MLPVLVDLIPVQFSPAGINVHLLDGKPSLTLPCVAACPEEKHDGHSQVLLEEGFGSVAGAKTLISSGWDEGRVELWKF